MERFRLSNDARHITEMPEKAVQFNHNGVSSISLVVWMYHVLDETMCCPILLRRDSWMYLCPRSYQILPSTPDGRVFGFLTIPHICDNDSGGAAAHIRNCDAPDIAYNFVNNGEDLSLDNTPKSIPVCLDHLDGFLALTGHYITDILQSFLLSEKPGMFCFLGPTDDPAIGISRARI